MGLDVNVNLPEGETATDVSGDQKTEIEKMIETLEAVNVTTDEDLQGKLQASQQTGNLANLLGETRTQVKQLQDTVANQQPQPSQTPTDGFLDSFETPVQGITIDQLTDVLDKREAKQREVATQAQQYAVAQYNAITRDKHYPVVKQVWEAKMRDPIFANGVNTGRVNPITAYQSTVIEFLAGVNANTLKTLQGVIKTPGENEDVTLHLEGGERGEEPQPTFPGANPEPKDIQKYQDHVNTGGSLTEQDELNLLQTVLKG